MLYGDWSAESGYRNGLVLGWLPDVTAVFVGSDEMTFGVVRALADLGRRVPEDVSVVAMDDIALARYCSPPLPPEPSSASPRSRARLRSELLEVVWRSRAVAPWQARQHSRSLAEPCWPAWERPAPACSAKGSRTRTW